MGVCSLSQQTCGAPLGATPSASMEVNGAPLQPFLELLPACYEPQCARNSLLTEIPLGAKGSLCPLPLPWKWQIPPLLQKANVVLGIQETHILSPALPLTWFLSSLACCSGLQFPHLQMKKLDQIIVQVIVHLPQKACGLTL